MKIYTKTGDQGETSLYRGGRVPKDGPLLEAYGTVDELNAILGICRSAEKIDPEINKMLTRVQNELFDLGADLATPWKEKSAGGEERIHRISEAPITRLEQEIDRTEKELQPLTAFILPGGSRVSALLHLARTVCRRAERSTVAATRKNGCNPLALVYLNRLSDWLFTVARLANRRHNVADIPWVAEKR